MKRTSVLIALYLFSSPTFAVCEGWIDKELSQFGRGTANRPIGLDKVEYVNEYKKWWHESTAFEVGYGFKMTDPDTKSGLIDFSLNALQASKNPNASNGAVRKKGETLKIEEMKTTALVEKDNRDGTKTLSYVKRLISLDSNCKVTSLTETKGSMGFSHSILDKKNVQEKWDLINNYTKQVMVNETSVHITYPYCVSMAGFPIKQRNKFRYNANQVDREGGWIKPPTAQTFDSSIKLCQQSFSLDMSGESVGNWDTDTKLNTGTIPD